MTPLSRCPIRFLAGLALFLALSAAQRFRPASPRAPPSRASPNTVCNNGLRVLLFPDATPAQDHGQHHLSGRLAHGELRRDRHGAPARAHGLQGHAVARQHHVRARPARHGLQRHDLARPHQLLRDLLRVRRKPRLGAGDGSRPHGQLVHRAQGPRQRDDGRAQRNGAQREQPGAHSDPADHGRRRTTGTTTARTRSARAPTSSTSTSARLQAFYHLYYQPDNAVLVIAGAFDPDKALALVAKYFGPIPKPTRVLPRLYTDEPVQDGERRGHAAPRRQYAVAVRAVSHRAGRASGRGRDRGRGRRHDRRAPAAACTRRWSKRKKASAVDDFVYNGHDPGFAMFLAQVPDKDSIDARARRHVADDRGRQGAAGHRARSSTACAPRRSRRSSETINDPQRLGVALSQSIADRRLASVLPAPRPVARR